MAKKIIKEWLSLKEFCEQTDNEIETVRKRLFPVHIKKTKVKYKTKEILLPPHKIEEVFGKPCIFLKNPKFKS